MCTYRTWLHSFAICRIKVIRRGQILTFEWEPELGGRQTKGGVPRPLWGTPAAYRVTPTFPLAILCLSIHKIYYKPSFYLLIYGRSLISLAKRGTCFPIWLCLWHGTCDGGVFVSITFISVTWKEESFYLLTSDIAMKICSSSWNCKVPKSISRKSCTWSYQQNFFLKKLTTLFSSLIFWVFNFFWDANTRAKLLRTAR